jgi:hypothetical protein
VNQNKKVVVLTVGLNETYQGELDERLATHEEIATKHLDAWTFTVTNSDVLVLNVDSDAGQETLSMLRSFRGPNDPVVVTFSESDDRMHAWRSPADGKEAAAEIIPGFCKRLEAALRKSGCDNVHIDEMQRRVDRAVEDGDEPKSTVRDMRWTG